jgi:DNA polymerase III epsilon subunit-like protein
MKVIVFDTETTGLPESFNTPVSETNKYPYIVQLSWIVYDTVELSVLRIQDHVINCGVEIPQEATDVHGITTQLSKQKGISINVALDLFDIDLNLVDLVVAHNISFDRNMYMVESLRNYRIQYMTPDKATYCTMKKNIKMCNLRNISSNRLKYPKLVELHKVLFNSTPKGVHDSLVDVLICLRCYIMITQGDDVIETNKVLTKMYERCR